MNQIRVCLAGAAGWAGSELSRGIFGTEYLELVAAVSRRHAGKTLGEILRTEGLLNPIFDSVNEALKTDCTMPKRRIHPAEPRASVPIGFRRLEKQNLKSHWRK